MSLLQRVQGCPERGAVLAAASKTIETGGICVSAQFGESHEKGKVAPSRLKRLPGGVRLTALGAAACERAGRLMREFAEAQEHMAKALAGRHGRIPITATRFCSADICPATGLTGPKPVPIRRTLPAGSNPAVLRRQGRPAAGCARKGLASTVEGHTGR